MNLVVLPTNCTRDAMKKKPSSRWDTPSPSFDQSPQLNSEFSSPSYHRGPGRGHQLGSENHSDEEGWNGGYGRGRGRGKKKRNRKRTGKNKYVLRNRYPWR